MKMEFNKSWSSVDVDIRKQYKKTIQNNNIKNTRQQYKKQFKETIQEINREPDN